MAEYSTAVGQQQHRHRNGDRSDEHQRRKQVGVLRGDHRVENRDVGHGAGLHDGESGQPNRARTTLRRQRPRGAGGGRLPRRG